MNRLTTPQDPTQPRYFYIYEINSLKIEATYAEKFSELAYDDYRELLKKHGPHYLIVSRRGPRLGAGDKMPS